MGLTSRLILFALNKFNPVFLVISKNLMGLIIRKNEYDQERPQSRTAGKSPGTIRKSHTTFTKHQEDEKTYDNQLYLPHQDDKKLDGTKY